MATDSAASVSLYNLLLGNLEQRFGAQEVDERSDSIIQAIAGASFGHEPIEKLGLMLDYLDNRIKELKAIRCSERPNGLITQLRAYVTHFRAKEPSSVDDINLATALTFTMAVRAKTLNPHFHQKEVELCGQNTSIGRCLADRLRGKDQQAEVSYRFNGWRFAAGLALFILGAGLAVGAACSIAVFFGATTPFAVAVAQYGLEMAAVSALYLFSTLIVACGKGRVKTTAPVFTSIVGGLAAGVATEAAGAIPATASINSGIAGTGIAFSGSWGPITLFSGLAASATAALTALASGGYLMWSSRAAGKTLVQEGKYESVCSTAKQVLRLRGK